MQPAPLAEMASYFGPPPPLQKRARLERSPISAAALGTMILWGLGTWRYCCLV